MDQLVATSNRLGIPDRNERQMRAIEKDCEQSLQGGKGADCLLDQDAVVDPMHLEYIDNINAKARERQLNVRPGGRR